MMVHNTQNYPAILALSKRPNWVGVFPPHLRTETDLVSETLCFLVSRIPDDGQSKKTVILSIRVSCCVALVSAVLNIHILLAQWYIFKIVCAFFPSYTFMSGEKLKV
jgi:hypothetical protein